MNTRTFFLLIALSMGGCYRGKNSQGPTSPLNPAAPAKILMQIICCDPASMKPQNAATCAALAPLRPPNDALDLNGVRITMTTSAAACQNLDETPFWGEPS